MQHEQSGKGKGRGKDRRVRRSPLSPIIGLEWAAGFAQLERQCSKRTDFTVGVDASGSVTVESINEIPPVLEPQPESPSSESTDSGEQMTT
jgi:hypothetical protein